MHRIKNSFSRSARNLGDVTQLADFKAQKMSQLHVESEGKRD